MSRIKRVPMDDEAKLLDDVEMRHIGERLRKARKKLNITSTEMACQVQVEPQSYSRYENGHSRPRLSVLYQIAQYLGVSVDYLLFGIRDDETQMTEADPTISDNLISIIELLRSRSDDEIAWVEQVIKVMLDHP